MSSSQWYWAMIQWFMNPLMHSVGWLQDKVKSIKKQESYTTICHTNWGSLCKTGWARVDGCVKARTSTFELGFWNAKVCFGSTKKDHRGWLPLLDLLCCVCCGALHDSKPTTNHKYSVEKKQKLLFLKACIWGHLPACFPSWTIWRSNSFASSSLLERLRYNGSGFIYLDILHVHVVLAKKTKNSEFSPKNTAVAKVVSLMMKKYYLLVLRFCSTSQCDVLPSFSLIHHDPPDFTDQFRHGLCTTA